MAPTMEILFLIMICFFGCLAKKNCILPLTPSTKDLIQLRLCLNELGDTNDDGRSKRSVEEKEMKDSLLMSKLREITIGKESDKLDTLFKRGAGKKSICDGLSWKECDKRIKEYEKWKRENGIGKDEGRWGRSAAPRGHNVKSMLAKYWQWRQKNGYGKPMGRWGRSIGAYKRKSEQLVAEYMRRIQQYQSWRQRNGYGRAVGRWG